MTAPSSSVRWLAHYAEEPDEPLFRIGRAGDEVVAEWVGLATLRARRDGSAVRFEPAPDADLRELAKVRRGGAALLVRHLRGELAMHGAAVAFGDHAVALLGRSGQGKSTLAAALCARGGCLLSDDALHVDHAGDGWVLAPVEPDHWLDPPARAALGLDGEGPEGGKLPVAAPRRASMPARLVAFVDLAFGGQEVGLRRLEGLDAAAALVPQIVRFVLDEPEAQRAELEMLLKLVGQVTVYRMDRPRGMGYLRETSERIAALLPLPHPAPPEFEP